MKKLTLFLIAICTFLIINVANAQKYYPLVDTNKTWGINMKVVATGGALYVWCIKFTQDTTINKIVYKKVMQSYNSLPNSWKNIGYIRETPDKKVYYLRNKTDTIEQLLYNFNLKKGDSTCIGYIEDNCRTFFVDTIDSIYLEKQFRKRIVLNYREVWIEGVGSLCGVLYSGLSEIGGAKYILSCFRENDTLKYADTAYIVGFDFYSICFLGPNNTINYREPVYSIKAFPNPAHSVLNIITNIKNCYSLNVNIYDLVGKEILTQNIKTNDKIDVTNLPQGMYFLKLQTNYNISVLKFIKD